MKFGANLNRFENIGVDLNAGVRRALVLSSEFLLAASVLAGWMRLKQGIACGESVDTLDGLVLPGEQK